MNLTPDRAASAVERHDCPNCSAPAGSACRTRAGKTAAKYHTGRFVLVPALREELDVPVPADRGPGRTWQQGPALAVVPAPRTERAIRIGLAGQIIAAAKGNHGGRPKVIDDDSLTFALALKDKGVPVPDIAKKLTIKPARTSAARRPWPR